MSDRKPQIAYALVRPTGEIVLGCLASSELGARLFLYQASGGTKEQAEAAGWRIARVRIELDEEKSGE